MEEQEKVNKPTYPTEVVELPSKGLLYSPDSPLSKGKIEIKYPTAKEEDILTNQNYIQKGIVIDKFLKEIIVTPIDYNDLTIGDKNAIMVSARILAYGADYKIELNCPKCQEKNELNANLGKLENKELDEEKLNEANEVEFELPYSKVKLTFKILTVKDEKKIEEELKFQKKLHKKQSPELTTRLKYIITSVDGDTEQKTIRNFVENDLLARDSLALRREMSTLMPDIDMRYPFECSECEHEDVINIPITVQFFWPNA